METPHSRKLTYDDYVRLPDDNLRHEIIGGEHYVTPSPVLRHQRISRRLIQLIANFLDEHPLGEVFDAPVDVLLGPHDIVVPDLAYVSRERAVVLREQNLQGPPDLVVEILSPKTRRRDERLKRDLYERAGVQEYWLVDLDRSEVTVYRRRGPTFEAPATRAAAAGDILTTPLLPGFEASLNKLFV